MCWGSIRWDWVRVPACTAAVTGGVDDLEVAEVVEDSAGLAVAESDLGGEVSSGPGTTGERRQGAGLDVGERGAGAVGVAVVAGPEDRGGHCGRAGSKAWGCEASGRANPDHAKGPRAELVDDPASIERTEDQRVPGMGAVRPVEVSGVSPKCRPRGR